MLPLFKYAVNTAVIAPALVKHLLKRPVCYDEALTILTIAAGLNVLSNVRIGKITPKSLFDGLFGMIAGVGFYYVVSVIFGAYYCAAFERTLAFALWMSSMTAFPLGRLYGLDFNKWYQTVIRRDDHGNSDEAHLICGIYSLWFGAWASCVVIPLDWDRPWQKWPVPNAIGVLIMCLTTSAGFWIKGCVKCKGWCPASSTSKASTAKTPQRKASPASAKASPAPTAAKSPAKPAAKSPVKAAAAAPKTPTRKAPAAASTRARASRSPSKSPTKRSASPTKAAASTPKSARSRSKVATPATARASSRLSKRVA